MTKSKRKRVSLWMIMAVGLLTGPVVAGPPRPASDEQIKDMIAATGDTEEYDKADLVTVLDEADVYVQKSGLATTESCQVIKVLTDEGIRVRSVLRWPFDPDTYRVTIKTVRVHRKGGPIEEVDLTSLITQPATQHLIYWGGQQHVLSVPRLNVGDTLEIRISKIGFNIAYLTDKAGRSTAGGLGAETLTPPMPGHWYEVTLFQTDHPILMKRYSVHMPKDMPLQYEVYNGSLKSSLWFDSDTHVYTWEDHDIAPIKEEPHSVSPDDSATKVVLATLDSWEAKSRWFHDVNETQFESDDAIRDKVRALTAGLDSDEEKIAACTHWVADNIRYYGTKRGSCEGFTLHRSIETFKDRGGVCKDKAGMLITMLRVLGHEAYPALTMAGSRVEAIPADQFNHTVTVMRNQDGSFRILDPTWVPLSRDLWSNMEHLQGLVYGTPEGQSLTLSPYFEPEENVRSVRSLGEIREDGSLSTKITMDLNGAACNRFRRGVYRYPKHEQRAAFERALNIAPNARLEKLTFTDPHDYSRDTHVEFAVSAARYAGGGNGVALFRLPLMSHPLNKFFRATFLDELKEEERQRGLRFWATRMLHYQETLSLPEDWEIVQVPEPVSLDSESASLTFEATQGEGELTYRFEFVLKKGVIPPQDYPDYKKAVDTMYRLRDEWVVCRVKGPNGGQAQHAMLSSEEREGTGE